MRVVGLDVGEKRIGMAVSDPFGWTAQGLPTYDWTNHPQDPERLRARIAEAGAQTLVVGLPLNMDGSEGPQAVRVRTFVERLLEGMTPPLPVVWQDERLSSVAARGVLVEADLSRKKRKGKVDRLAAQLILQGYLDQKGRK